MSQHSLLIRCAPPRSEDREDIENWLAARVEGLAGEGALLYHFAPPRAGATSDGRGDAWVVELAAPEQTASPDTISVLLADMRLLGLDPVIFRVDRDRAQPRARPDRA